MLLFIARLLEQGSDRLDTELWAKWGVTSSKPVGWLAYSPNSTKPLDYPENRVSLREYLALTAEACLEPLEGDYGAWLLVHMAILVNSTAFVMDYTAEIHDMAFRLFDALCSANPLPSWFTFGIHGEPFIKTCWQWRYYFLAHSSTKPLVPRAPANLVKMDPKLVSFHLGLAMAISQ